MPGTARVIGAQYHWVRECLLSEQTWIAARGIDPGRIVPVHLQDSTLAARHHSWPATIVQLVCVTPAISTPFPHRRGFYQPTPAASRPPVPDAVRGADSYATMLGLGQKTGIDLPQEASGVMPSKEWKVRNFKQKWIAGETISVGIGQGAVAVTPIQMAGAFAAIASGGHMVRPHVTNPTDLPPGVVQASDVPDQITVPLDPKNWEIITDAMAQVVSPVGTAALSQIKDVDMAGKTGSAQTISNMLKAKMSASDKARHKDNGWFVGVEPRRNPEIVVCGLYEEGEHGDKTARVVAQVIKAFVDKQRRNPQKMAGKPQPGGKVEIGAVWTTPDLDGDKDRLQSGHFFLEATKKPLALATAAPGLR